MIGDVSVPELIGLLLGWRARNCVDGVVYISDARSSHRWSLANRSQWNDAFSSRSRLRRRASRSPRSSALVHSRMDDAFVLERVGLLLVGFSATIGHGHAAGCVL